MKYFIFVAGLLALLLGACGSPSAATNNPAQAQTFAAASAAAEVTATQPATPTETPTLLPTETPIPSATATSTKAKDNCRHALDGSQAGKAHSTIIKNEASGLVSVSLTLYKPNAFGQCGYIVVSNMHGGDLETVDLPAGSWSAYAWAKGNSSAFIASGSFVVQTALSKKMMVCVRSGKIVYQSQC